MILGLLKLMRGASFMGYPIGSDVPFGTHFITDGNAASRKIGRAQLHPGTFHSL